MTFRESASVTVTRPRYRERTRTLARGTMIALPAVVVLVAVGWASARRRLRRSVPALMKAGAAHLFLKEYKTALAEFGRAIRISPFLAEAYCGRGAAYQGLGDFERGAGRLRPGHPVRSRVAHAFIQRGRIRTETGDLDGALADLSRVMEIQPSDPELYLNRGICFFKKGLMVDAAADFQRVLKLTNHSDFAEPAKEYLRQLDDHAAGSLRPPAPPQTNGVPIRGPARPETTDHRSETPRLAAGSTPPRATHGGIDRCPQRIDRSAGPGSGASAAVQAARIGGDPSPRETSGTFTPAVIEDIQIKAELARYRIRGFGSLRPRTWATFDDLTFIPGTLTRIPLEGYREACSTRTVLGTRFAAQPLELEIPLMVTGMSFGALSRNAKAGAGAGAGMAGTSTTTGDGGMLDVERTESRVLVYEVLPSRYGIDVRHLRQADAIELTIGQGAKPGTGGLLLGLEGLGRDRPAPRPAARRRSALALPASRLPRPRRHGDQDRGAARGDRLAGADLRQDGGLARLRRRPPRRQGRRRRGRRRRHGRGHRRLARVAPGAHRHPDPGRRLRGPRRPGGHRPVRRGPARSSPAACGTAPTAPRPSPWVPTPATSARPS